jgi:DNA polymerase III gamma/tau subunit
LYTILTQHNLDTATASLVAALAEGRADRFSLENVSETLALRQTAHTILQNVAQATGMDSFLQARQLAGKREQCEALLHWLSLFLRDLTMLSVAPSTELYNRDLSTQLAPLAQRAQPDQLIEAFTQLQQFRAYLGLNSNPQLIFEQSLIQIHQAFSSVTPA